MSLQSLVGCLVAAAVTLAASGSPAARTSASPIQAEPVASPERALLNQYCVGCHNDRPKSGGLSLPGRSLEHGRPDRTWETVVRKLRARCDAAGGRSRGRTKPATHSWCRISRRRSTAHAAAHPDPGRTDTFRRLTRTEYQNAIRDLLALDVDVTELLPKDDASYGFDNVSRGRTLADAARNAICRRRRK